MLPKKISFKKKLFPILRLIFIQKNLLPKFFLPRICCQTFLLSIFLLTIKFFSQKFLQNILLAKVPPHKNLSSKIWSPKFPLKKICFKKKLLPILPPPPQRKKSLKRICSPNISYQNLLPNIFALHITSHKKLLPKFCSPKSLCCPNHFVEQLWHLINTGAVAGYSAVPAALLLIFCLCLKIVIEQKKHHLDLQYVQGIPLQQLPGS